MELGLSLGDNSTTPRPFGFLAKNREIKSTPTNRGLEFCMALGINSNGKRLLQDQERDKSSGDGDDESEAVKRSRSTRNGDRTVSVDPPLQLALSWPSDNGSSEGGSSEKVRGFDVNRLPPAAADAEDGAAVSSPNSVASSFQMDFCVFRGAGNKRDLEAAAAAAGVNDGGDAERASSRASDDDENALSRKKLRLSKEQSAYLEESFKEHNTLNPKQKLALAKQLNLRPRQVEVWFQNRRARTKLKQTEVDCEYLKRCCETLTEENRRLHKELQELRALKNSNPFYMQLPATTLTMCPSCERVATTTTTTSAAAASASTVINNTTNTSTDSKSKAANPFALSRPRFYPFSQSQPPHQPAAS
ncbi:homeobox-leucine zipper protein HOX11-like [Rhododendron vialii]|uniref:homeobox-leucine zipper protein HOX11-like n=1 Tax=Rhododendron vialii TaxID=182163 RepID=UPI00265F8462|nr:homeobox-leucine zipper protein HOX11-like [Rhododendron vialii]